MTLYKPVRKIEKPKQTQPSAYQPPQPYMPRNNSDPWPRPKDRKWLIGACVGSLLLFVTGAYFALGIGSRYSTRDSQVTQQYESVSMGATEEEGRSAIKRSIHDVYNELNIEYGYPQYVDVMDKFPKRDNPDLVWGVFKNDERILVIALNYRTSGEPEVLRKSSGFVYDDIISLDQSDITTPDYVERFFYNRLLNIVSRYY